MFDLNTLKFDEKGLIPAIVVDTNTKQVLTLAYMNQESLEISMREGLHLLLEPQPPRALAQGRDLRQPAAYRLHHR